MLGDLLGGTAASCRHRAILLKLAADYTVARPELFSHKPILCRMRQVYEKTRHEGKMPHFCNSVQLDGQWYTVDMESHKVEPEASTGKKAEMEEKAHRIPRPGSVRALEEKSHSISKSPPGTAAPMEENAHPIPIPAPAGFVEGKAHLISKPATGSAGRPTSLGPFFRHELAAVQGAHGLFRGQQPVTIYCAKGSFHVCEWITELTQWASKRHPHLCHPVAYSYELGPPPGLYASCVTILYEEPKGPLLSEWLASSKPSSSVLLLICMDVTKALIHLHSLGLAYGQLDHRSVRLLEGGSAPIARLVGFSPSRYAVKKEQENRAPTKEQDVVMLGNWIREMQSHSNSKSLMDSPTDLDGWLTVLSSLYDETP